MKRSQKLTVDAICEIKFYQNDTAVIIIVIMVTNSGPF